MQQNESPKWVLSERHWMHIWKVGYQRCALCTNDSRVIASRIDCNNNVLKQVLYCIEHARDFSTTIDGGVEPHAPSLDLDLGIDIELHTSDKN